MLEIYGEVRTSPFVENLLELVEMAEQREVLLLPYYVMTDNGNSIYHIGIGGKTGDFVSIEEDDCLELEQLGLIQRVSGSVYLTQAGVDCAKYYRKNAIQKWITRNYRLLSFIVTIIVIAALCLFFLLQIEEWKRWILFAFTRLAMR